MEQESEESQRQVGLQLSVTLGPSIEFQEVTPELQVRPPAFPMRIRDNLDDLKQQSRDSTNAKVVTGIHAKKFSFNRKLSMTGNPRLRAAHSNVPDMNPNTPGPLNSFLLNRMDAQQTIYTNIIVYW